MKPPTDLGCGHQQAGTDGPDRLLTINEVADWIGVSVSTLYQHGYQHKGPNRPQDRQCAAIQTVLRRRLDRRADGQVSRVTEPCNSGCRRTSRNRDQQQ